MAKSKKATAPDPVSSHLNATFVSVEVTLPSVVHVPLQKGAAGIAQVDAESMSAEGRTKAMLYGITRYLKDGAPSGAHCIANGLDVNTEAVVHAEARMAALRGEAPIVSKSAGVPPIVRHLRTVLLATLKRNGVEPKKVGKLGASIADAFAAAERACPGVSAHAEAIMAHAQRMVDAENDVPDINLSA